MMLNLFSTVVGGLITVLNTVNRDLHKIAQIIENHKQVQRCSMF